MGARVLLVFVFRVLLVFVFRVLGYYQNLMYAAGGPEVGGQFFLGVWFISFCVQGLELLSKLEGRWW